jgi:hypothetical protein
MLVSVQGATKTSDSILIEVFSIVYVQGLAKTSNSIFDRGATLLVFVL